MILPAPERPMDDGSSGNGNGCSIRKRRRRGRSELGEEDEDEDEEDMMSSSHEGVRRKDANGIFTSFLKRDEAAKEERQVFQTNRRKKSRSMLNYYSDLEDCCTGVKEIGRGPRKKSRASSGVMGTVVEKGGRKGGGRGGFGGESGQQHRRLWVKDRSKAWWDECNRPEFLDEEFKKAFRMRKSTFDVICGELNSVIAKEDTALRTAIPVRQRVAVCIWRLATGEPLRLVSKRFGLGISTCHKMVLEVCSAIRTVLMPKYLQWPDEDSLQVVKDEFTSVSGIPNVVGSMYTTHIPIIAPKISAAAYFNRRHTERNQKTSYSITLQGVIDPKGVFTDVCIGWPGSMSDDAVLEKSALYQRANSTLKGEWIVGNAGYPLLDWLLVPYTQQHLTWTQHAFNEKIGEAQGVARDAFARLKGRWSCLQKRTEVKLQDLPVVLGACCVLHNICEMSGEEMEKELRFELVDDEMVPEVALRSASSTKARDSIAHNLLHHGLAGTAFL